MTPTIGMSSAGISQDMRASSRNDDRRADGEAIAEGMAWAEKVACRPGNHRCYPLHYDVKSAHQTCTPKGRCKIGWIVANNGRDSWDVWLDVHIGEGRLRRQRE